MTGVALSLGSNLGDKLFYIQKMEKALEEIFCGPVKKSTLMETEPLGVKEPQDWYMNRIISGFFEGQPEELLMMSNSIENELGRDKKSLLAPRTADIDILLFGMEIVDTAHLRIPHPAILQRRFCLEGLNQIVPDWIIPGTALSVNLHYKKMCSTVQAQKIRFLQSE